jgi:outer membrane protein assembly factor BamB
VKGTKTVNWKLAAGICCILSSTVFADDWPQWMGPRRDGVWRESRIIEAFPESGPDIVWRTPIGGGYAGPAVFGDRVYVLDKILPREEKDPESPFTRGDTNATERVLCLEAINGKILWKHEYPCRYTVSYPAGPRSTPLVTGKKVYTLGAEGDLYCLNALNGEKIWYRNLKKDYHLDPSPVWGFASNPLLDENRLIVMVGGTDTAVVAFDANSGKEIWHALTAAGPHGAGYSSPVIADTVNPRQLIVWHPQAIAGLVPETGKVLWEQPFESREGLSVVTPRINEDRVFISSFYTGSMMLKLNSKPPRAEVLWKRGGENEKHTDALHSIFATPMFDGETIYGCDSYGEFRALDAKNGNRLWSTYAPTSGKSARWGTAFIVKDADQDRYVLFNEQGDLIFADLSPKEYQEISRAHIIDPTGPAQRRDVVWSHPAFANRCVYARNDKEIVCVDLRD